MFPCNFLSYLRVHYSEQQKENYTIFTHTIKPMLNTVKMHPMLVTQTKDYEKTASRWKRMELHDIIVESSRYSLDTNENTKEEEVQATPRTLFSDTDNLSIKSNTELGMLSHKKSLIKTLIKTKNLIEKIIIFHFKIFQRPSINFGLYLFGLKLLILNQKLHKNVK